MTRNAPSPACARNQRTRQVTAQHEVDQRRQDGVGGLKEAERRRNAERWLGGAARAGNMAGTIPSKRSQPLLKQHFVDQRAAAGAPGCAVASCARADRPGLHEANKTPGEHRCLRPGCQPDRQRFLALALASRSRLCPPIYVPNCGLRCITDSAWPVGRRRRSKSSRVPARLRTRARPRCAGSPLNSRRRDWRTSYSTSGVRARFS